MRADDERRAQRLVQAAGTVVLVLFVALTATGPSAPVIANPPGFTNPVAAMELAGTPADVFGILGTPGIPGRLDAVRRMRLSLLLDTAFLVAYPLFHTGVARWLRARGRLAPAFAAVVVGLAVLMVVGDALENREIWVLTGVTDPTAMGPPLARLRVFTTLKWHAVFGASAILAFGAAQETGWWRWSAALFGTGAAVGFASVVYLPAIERSLLPLGLAWTMTWVRALRGR